MAYNSKYTGAEVDALLDKVAENDVISIDSALSTTSENPVQNKAIAEEFKRVDALEEIHKTLDVTVEKLVKEKVDAMDYAPNLSVGLADNLAGEDEVDSEISFRRSGGGAISDGVARIEAIKGNSVVWNQLVEQWNFGTLSSKWQTQSSSIAVINNELVITANGATNVLYQEKFLANHKYRIVFEVKSASVNPRCRIGLYDGNSFVVNEYVQVANDKFTNVELIVTPSTECVAIYIRPDSDVSLTSGEQAYIRNFRIYDLTKMFQVGNEPTTIEEFNARKPLGIDENAYNEGEVIHMDAQSLESVGVNQWDEEWESGTIAGSDGKLVNDATKIRTSNLIRVLPNKEYHFTQPSQLPIRVFWYGADKTYKAYEYFAESTSVLIPSDVYYIKVVFEYATYNHNICINLSDASVNGKYFPYIKRTQSLDVIGKYFPEGMKSAGTAHDEIRYNKATQKWEKVVRIGEVDMGSLNWRYLNESDGSWRFVVQFPLIKEVSSDEIANALVSLFPTVTGWEVYQNRKEGVSVVGLEYLGIYDKRYEGLTSSEFKAAMTGVILYYELAEPIVTEIEDDFNLDYEVWNGGTEKIVSDVPTTPLKADIAYGFNAVGKIKELEEKISQMAAQILQMQASLTQSISSTNEI